LNKETRQSLQVRGTGGVKKRRKKEKNSPSNKHKKTPETKNIIQPTERFNPARKPAPPASTNIVKGNKN